MLYGRAEQGERNISPRWEASSDGRELRGKSEPRGGAAGAPETAWTSTSVENRELCSYRFTNRRVIEVIAKGRNLRIPRASHSKPWARLEGSSVCRVARKRIIYEKRISRRPCRILGCRARKERRASKPATLKHSHVVGTALSRAPKRGFAILLETGLV
jgi:hypothetical protein